MAPAATYDLPRWCKISMCDCGTKQDSIVRLTLSECASEQFETLRSDDATLIEPDTSVYCCSLSKRHYTVPSDAILTRVREGQPWKLVYNSTFGNDPEGESPQRPVFESGYQKLEKGAYRTARETPTLDTSRWNLVMRKQNPRASEQL